MCKLVAEMLVRRGKELALTCKMDNHVRALSKGVA